MILKDMLYHPAFELLLSQRQTVPNLLKLFRAFPDSFCSNQSEPSRQAHSASSLPQDKPYLVKPILIRTWKTCLILPRHSNLLPTKKRHVESHRRHRFFNFPPSSAGFKINFTRQSPSLPPHTTPTGVSGIFHLQPKPAKAVRSRRIDYGSNQKL